MGILSRLRLFSLLREACTEYRLYRLGQYRFSFRMKRLQVRAQILIELQRAQIESLLKQKDVAMKNAVLAARHKVTQAEIGRLEKLRKIAAEKGVALPMKTGCESEVVSGIVSQVQRNVDMALRQSGDDGGTGVMTAVDKNKQFAKNVARDAVKYVLDEAQRECNAKKRTGVQKMGADFMQGPLLAAQIAKRLGVNDAEMETLLKRLEESEGRQGNSEENSEFANVFKHTIRDAMRHVKASDPKPGTTTAQKNAE